jgi:hypothetical protein
MQMLYQNITQNQTRMRPNIKPFAVSAEEHIESRPSEGRRVSTDEITSRYKVLPIALALPRSQVHLRPG